MKHMSIIDMHTHTRACLCVCVCVCCVLTESEYHLGLCVLGFTDEKRKGGVVLLDLCVCVCVCVAEKYTWQHAHE
jgi:hypothetical protein